MTHLTPARECQSAVNLAFAEAVGPAESLESLRSPVGATRDAGADC